jgi:hypothetical protein
MLVIEYNIGDVVMIRPDLRELDQKMWPSINSEMLEQAGKVAKITNKHAAIGHDYHYYTFDKIDWNWIADWIMPCNMDAAHEMYFKGFITHDELIKVEELANREL